jgi:6-phosphogluconolactonase
MEREIQRYADLETLSQGAAALVCDLAEASAQDRGVFVMALAGGKTPQGLYEHLARAPVAGRMPWPKIHFFWGDERCVPTDHPDSNFAMAFRTLLSQVPMPPVNIHRVPVEEGSAEDAARAYEEYLRMFFDPRDPGFPGRGSSAQKRGFPSFDLILLGVGEDGHTASLFPEDQALEETGRWVVAPGRPRGSPPVPRVTFTLPMINQARCVLFLAAGMAKREVVRSIIEDPDEVNCIYPAARVRPKGRVVWFVDREVLP